MHIDQSYYLLIPKQYYVGANQLNNRKDFGQNNLEGLASTPILMN